MHHAVASLFKREHLTLIAGPCVIESVETCLQTAQRCKEICERFEIPYIFKCSFDKANRTSVTSYRGPGIDEGLRTLERVKQECDVPVLTDIHDADQATAAGQVVDVLQIPAFLCRQTDLLVSAGKSGCPTNIKKGQFVAPQDMKHAVDKFRHGGGSHVCLTERGTSFGYQDLVVDFRGLRTMREIAPVVFDATHSVQRPGGLGDRTGGDRTLAPLLARAATAAGVDGIFCEVHPSPDDARSDGPNSLTFELLESLLGDARRIRQALQ